MKLTFVETRQFEKRVPRVLDDVAFERFKKELAVNPTLGKVIPGTGGLRKQRLGDPNRGKGKRGGARVIYQWVPISDLVIFVMIYGHDQKDDLTPKEKDLAREEVNRIKQEFLKRKER